jgi:hypothetical protein
MLSHPNVLQYVKNFMLAIIENRLYHFRVFSQVHIIGFIVYWLYPTTTNNFFQNCDTKIRIFSIQVKTFFKKIQLFSLFFLTQKSPRSGGVATAPPSSDWKPNEFLLTLPPH